MPDATVGGRIGVILRDRLADLPRLFSAMSNGPRTSGKGPLVQIAPGTRWRSLVAAFYMDRFLWWRHRRQLAELNRWARDRLRDGCFHGDRFVLEFPREYPNAAEVALADLREIYLENRYSAMLPFQQLVQEGDVVLDCGANIGAFAVYAATRAAGVKVLAFEPEPITRATLQRNVSNNRLDSQVECLPYGLSDHPASFQVVRRTDCFTMHRLTEMAAGSGPESDTVECVRIDDLAERLARVDLVKMDIEGAEEKALLGASETLRRFRPRLTIASYHKPSDPWILSRTIQDICPDYNIIVSRDGCLYAWV